MSPKSLEADSILMPSSGKAPTSLVILLHGVGANGADLMSLADSWTSLLPDTEFIAPNAPDRCDGTLGYMEAYQWFSLDNITRDNREDRVHQAAPVLNDFLDRELALRGLTDDNLALVGFSQGTIMALHVALRRAKPCAGVLGYSGRTAGAENIASDIKSRPRVFLLHGEDDQVIPVSELHYSVEALKANDVPLLSLVIPRLGHSIDAQEVSVGGKFLDFCLSHPGQDLQAFAQAAGTI